MKNRSGETIHKILIVQTAFPGDVVLTLSLAQTAKRFFPESAVHFLTRPESGVLSKNHPDIDRAWFFDKRGKDRRPGSVVKLAKNLKKESFDLALIPHRSLRSALLVRFANIPRRIGFNRSAGAFLLTDVVRYPAGVHEVDRNLKLLEVFGWNGESLRPELCPGTEEKTVVDEFLHAHDVRTDETLAAVAPGSVWPTKRWPADRFAEVARTLWHKKQIRTVLIGGPEDIDLGELIQQQSGEAVINGVGRFSLLGSAELIRRCRVILTNDSAPLHLAVGVNTPVVAIFGPTLPRFGFAPFGVPHTIIEKELACRPCGIHGGRRCPKRHFQCMKAISYEEVARTLLGYLNDDRPNH
jgi:heptosyltransferase-2